MTEIRAREKFWFLDTLVVVRIAESANADGMSVMEHRIPYGSSPPLHVHHGEDEIFHLLSGEMRFAIDGKEVVARDGDTVLAPKGKPHTFVVTSPAGARLLTLTSRGDFERMVRAVSRPAESDGLPPPAHPTPAQLAALDAACRAYRIDLIGPPLSLESAKEPAFA